MEADYKKIATDARKKVLELIFNAQTSHIGSNFSCIDILAVLFEKIDLEKDKFILSKGWAAASLYYFLWTKGVITENELNSYCQEGSPFIGLSEPMGRFGLEFAGGSMGLGFPAAVGFALAKKLKGEEGIVYCLMSDGEIQSGTTWESSLIAVQHKLDNLTVIVDKNSWQAMGKTENILKSDFPSQGWDVWAVDGHSYEDIEHSLNCIYAHLDIGVLKTAPQLIIANTIKGKGWKRAENNNLYHYKQLSEEEYKEALIELNG